MHVMQDEVMTSKFHKMSVHNFLVEWQYLWKAAYTRDIFMWRFWRTSVIIDVRR